MRTLLIPAAFMMVFASTLMMIGLSVTHGLQRADAAYGIHVVEPIANNWFDADDVAIGNPAREHADEVGLLYY